MKNRLRQLRYMQGETQQNIADKLSISRSTYSAYETEKHELTLESLVMLANYYDVSLDYIIYRSDIPKCNMQLSKEQLHLLELFSQLNIQNRQVLFTLIHSLLESQCY